MDDFRIIWNNILRIDLSVGHTVNSVSVTSCNCIRASTPLRRREARASRTGERDKRAPRPGAPRLSRDDAVSGTTYVYANTHHTYHTHIHTHTQTQTQTHIPTHAHTFRITFTLRDFVWCVFRAVFRCSGLCGGYVKFSECTPRTKEWIV